MRSDANLIVVNAGSSAEPKTTPRRQYGSWEKCSFTACHDARQTDYSWSRGRQAGYRQSRVSGVRHFFFRDLRAPVVEEMLGRPRYHRPQIAAVTARKIPSKLGQEEFFRVKLGKWAAGRGGATSQRRRVDYHFDSSRRNLADSRFKRRHRPAADVQVELLRNLSEIDRTLVVIGSHDLTLDVLADELIPHNVFLSSSHVGSHRGIAGPEKPQLAFCDLPPAGYGHGRVQLVLYSALHSGYSVKVFHGVMREQGFIVPKGNPKAIRDFQDLARDDVVFVNRQAGAGTRVLLDYNLECLGLDPLSIRGYEVEEYTHTSVAWQCSPGWPTLHGSSGCLSRAWFGLRSRRC